MVGETARERALDADDVHGQGRRAIRCRCGQRRHRDRRRLANFRFACRVQARVFEQQMTFARASVAACLCAAAVAPVVTAGQAPAETPRILRVTSTADDNSAGTLRWAIERSNATPELEMIAIEVSGASSPITPGSALPAIKGPVQIAGEAWRRNGDYAVIDGSGYIPPGGPERCPGATAGQFGANVRTMTSPGLQLLDTSDVEISGVEIRRFCIGILINRATGVVI